MRQGRLPTELSRLKMLRGAAAGVLHMHRKGLLHRDIRRANVLLRGDDTALLADLGLARFVRRDVKAEYTQQGSPVPARWSAPVRALAPATFCTDGCACSQETLLRGKSSFASDVYMFGAFMFETLAGFKPFADVSEIDRVEELVKVGTKPVRPPGALGSAAAWALVDKCMAFKEAARPSLDDVIRELDTLIAAAGPTPVRVEAPTGPTVLDVLLTRPYAAKVNRDTASVISWVALASLLASDPDDVRELVAVEGKFALKGVIADMTELVKQYRPKE
jgi:serine/threonine protein kinase